MRDFDIRPAEKKRKCSTEMCPRDGMSDVFDDSPYGACTTYALLALDGVGS